MRPIFESLIGTWRYFNDDKVDETVTCTKESDARINCNYSNHGRIVATWIDGKFNWGNLEDVKKPPQW